MNEPKSKLSRRHVFAGAGAAGALAVVATVLPNARDGAATQGEAKEPSKDGGYQVTQHVLQYYQTARV